MKRRAQSGPPDPHNVPQAREHVAHHEAGHFVASYFQAMVDDGGEITIVRAGDAAGQYRHYGHPLADDCSRLEIERFIMEQFAGYEAEVQFDPSRAVAARACAWADDVEAEEWLRRLETNRTKRNRLKSLLRARTQSLLDEHWAAVSALAQELPTHQTIDAYEARWIVAIAEGETARKDLGEYRRNRDAPAQPASEEDVKAAVAGLSRRRSAAQR